MQTSVLISALRRALVVSIAVHIVLVIVVLKFHPDPRVADPELVDVDIDMAPTPLPVEALPEEVARMAEEGSGSAGDLGSAADDSTAEEKAEEAERKAHPEEYIRVDAGIEVDAPPDAPIDAPPDAAIDAPVDAKPDAPIDAKPDAPVDAKPDAPDTESTMDAGETVALNDAGVANDAGDLALNDAGATNDAGDLALNDAGVANDAGDLALNDAGATNDAGQVAATLDAGGTNDAGEVATTLDAGANDASMVAATLDAGANDAGKVAATIDAGANDAGKVAATIDASANDAGKVAVTIDAGTGKVASTTLDGGTGNGTVASATPDGGIGNAHGSGSGGTSIGSGGGIGGSDAFGTGSGNGFGSQGNLGSGSIAAENGSGSGKAGMTNEPAVDGAPTTAGTAANLLAYFPKGHVVTALIRFDRLRGTEWAAATERLLHPMPDYQVLFGTGNAAITDKLDTLIISTPRPKDAAATTLVGHTSMERAALREFLSASTPITWSAAKGGLLGKRTGRTFKGDQRVFLSPYKSWFFLAQPDDIAGLSVSAKGDLDTIEAKGKLPPWLAGMREIEKESNGAEPKGPALVVTLQLPGERIDLQGNDFGLGIKTFPTPTRVTLAMELVKQGWLAHGNMSFSSEKAAKEFVTDVTLVKQGVADSYVIKKVLGKPIVRVIDNLSFARTGGRVSYSTSVSIGDSRAILNALASQLDVYFDAQQPSP